MPKVTVYIPSYNYERYLDRAIRSVISQTMSDWELIVIDDGSTDNTHEVLSKYEGHDKIRVVEQENKGLNVTNNIAVRLANGQYIMRLDADDFLDENTLLILSNILDTKKDVGLVYPDYYHIDENENIIDIVRRKKIGEEVELLDLPAHGACTMIRRECLIELGGYHEEFSCQDGYDLWLKMIRRYEPYNVNIPLFYYRQHSKSLTKMTPKILETRRKIKRKFVDQYNQRRPNVLGIIPVTSHSIYHQGNPFAELAGKPLLWHTLNELENQSVLDRIILASDDDEVLNYGNRFSGIESFKRPSDFSKATLRIVDLSRFILNEMKSASNYTPDSVCILYITTPLRKLKHIEKAVDTMIIFDVDSVISTCEELSRCYQHRRFGLNPIGYSRGDLRLERDAIYRENSAIFLTRVENIYNGRLLGKKVGHITMLPEESVKINSEFELWLAEKIISDRDGKMK